MKLKWKQQGARAEVEEQKLGTVLEKYDDRRLINVQEDQIQRSLTTVRPKKPHYCSSKEATIEMLLRSSTSNT
jgi:hypothetical protein